jgi:hypothetical protein
MRALIFPFALLLVQAAAHAQQYAAGTFSIDGIPVGCGTVTTVVTSRINDVAQSDLLGRIYLNETALSKVPTVLKLWAYGHECGHYQVGTDELAADCWAIKTGKRQHWFRDSDFVVMEQFFRNNPGDLNHPPGEVRVEAMRECFGLPKKVAKVREEDTGDTGPTAGQSQLQDCREPPAPSERHPEFRDDLAYAEKQVRSARSDEAQHRRDAQVDRQRAERARARRDAEDVRLWSHSAQKSLEYADSDHRYYLEQLNKVAKLKCAIRAS